MPESNRIRDRPDGAATDVTGCKSNAGGGYRVDRRLPARERTVEVSLSDDHIRIDVSFACNDGHGRFTGRCGCFEFAQFQDELSRCSLVTPAELELKFIDQLSMVRVGAEEFRVSGARRRYEGNMLWDAVRMKPDEARRLVEYLVRKHEADWEELDNSEMGQFIERTCATQNGVSK